MAGNLVIIREELPEESDSSGVELTATVAPPILTAKVGKNCDLFSDLVKLYVSEGDIVADTTFGVGYFWKHVPLGSCTILGSDTEDRRAKKRKQPRSDAAFSVADLRALPYRSESVDVVVIDPPYGQLSTRPHKNDSFSFSRAYNLEAHRGGDGVMELYRSGVPESFRVLKPGGLAIIKCQDFVNGGRQHWLHVNVFSWAMEAGYVGEDLFVMVQDQQPMMRHKYQLHARKNHSYFWVFRKPER